ncbi:hypothetical protein, partial [Stenotrophomonas sp. PSU-St19]
MLRTELPSSTHGVDLAHHGPLRHRSAPGLAGIVGLRASIPGQHHVQRALIGFYPVFTDTYKKADSGHEECSCQSVG